MTKRIAEPAENPSDPVSETSEPRVDVPATVAMIEDDNPELAQAIREANPDEFEDEDVPVNDCRICSLVKGKRVPHIKSALHTEVHF